MQEFAALHGISRGTLYNRLKGAQSGQVIDQRHFNPGRPSAVPKCALGWALCYMATFPKAHLTDVHAQVSAVADQERWGSFSYDSFRRLYNKLPVDMRTLLRDGYRECYERTSLTVSKRSDYPNLLWQMDATEVKAWALDITDGSLFRPWMTTVIDTCCRVLPGVIFTRGEPNAMDVIALLRQAIMPKEQADRPFYGLPTRIEEDNHPVFQATDVKDAMVRLNVDYHPIHPGSPEENGKQERFFRRFKEQFCANLISYAHRTSGLAKAYKAAIPWPVLPRLASKYILEYHTKTHSALGKSPWEAWYEGIDQAQGLFFDGNDVLSALLVRYSKTVGVEGVRLGTRNYSAPELAGLVGSKIEVRHEPEGPGLRVPAYLRGEFLCELRSLLDDKALANEISAARLARLQELQAFRKDMLRLQEHLPTIPTYGVASKRKRSSTEPSAETSPDRPAGERDVSPEGCPPIRVPTLASEDG